MEHDPDHRLTKAVIVLVKFPILAGTLSFFFVLVPFLLLTGNQTSKMNAMSPALFWGILISGGLAGSVIAFRTCRNQWPPKPPMLTVGSPPPKPAPLRVASSHPPETMR